MEIRINGKNDEIDGEMSIEDYLSRRNIKPEEVVVELNGVIVSKDDYPSMVLAPNDCLEVLKFVGGG